MQAARRRLLLVSSSGGVLLELLALAPWWRQHRPIWAVVRAADTESALRGHDIHWIDECPATRPILLVPRLAQAIRLLRRVGPEIIVSAGSGAAVPFFLAARVLGIPSVWISTLNVVETSGRADRVCSRLASAVLVQRESLLPTHPGAIMVGELY